MWIAEPYRPAQLSPSCLKSQSLRLDRGLQDPTSRRSKTRSLTAIPWSRQAIRGRTGRCRTPSSRIGTGHARSAHSKMESNTPESQRRHQRIVPDSVRCELRRALGRARRKGGPAQISGACSAPIRPDLGLVVQNHIQQGIMDLRLSVVFDEAQSAELVHEIADARPGRADPNLTVKVFCFAHSPCADPCHHAHV